LSQPSRDLVKTLPDFLTGKAFISSDLPPEMKTVSRYVRDMVDEYRTSSNGKFRWEAIDPGSGQEDLEQEASRCKVDKIQIQVLRGTKFEMGSYYLGLCFQYGDKIESIPQISRAEGLEFEMSSLIKKLTVKKKKIAFTTGHGESDTSQGFRALKQVLEQEYDTTTVNPSSAEIGADVDALVIGGPKQALDDKAQREIDRFLMTGRGAVILDDGMAVSAPNQQFAQAGMGQIKMVQNNQTGLDKLLDTYGFKVGQDVIADNEAAMPGLVDMGGGRRGLTQLPIWVGVQIGKSPGISVLDGIRGLVFPLASTVDLVGPLAGGNLPAGGKLWKLASSGPNSWKHTGFFIINQATKIEETKGPWPVCLRLCLSGTAQERLREGPRGGSIRGRQAAPVRIAKASTPRGYRRLGFCQRRLRPAFARLPLLRGGRAHAPQRHRLDSGG
jgi:hypothetical protein